jgi:ribose-phosphate pyrophosphokinase
MKVFSGNSNKKLALKIVGKLRLQLSPVEIFVFPDLEKRIRIKEKVLNEDCVIIQTASTPPDENYMELFIMIDALKRSGARSVKAVIPYLGYQRQDHIFRDGEAVSLEVIAEILTKVGMTELYSFDLHSPKIPEIFTVPVHHLSALPLFAEKIKKDFINQQSVLVSPDMGGIRRIKEISDLLDNLPFATITKNRDLANGDINDSGIEGDVRGKIAIIVDDMISTGKTMVEASELLIDSGATKVYIFATHPVFARDANKLLQNSKIESVVVTDTIDVPSYNLFPKLEIVSVSGLAANALKTQV